VSQNRTFNGFTGFQAAKKRVGTQLELMFWELKPIPVKAFRSLRHPIVCRNENFTKSKYFEV